MNNFPVEKKPPSVRKRKMSDMMEDLQEALDAFDIMGGKKDVQPPIPQPLLKRVKMNEDDRGLNSKKPFVANQIQIQPQQARISNASEQKKMDL